MSTRAEDQPSLKNIDAVDNVKQDFTFAVLDDTNVALLTILVLGTTAASRILLGTSLIKATVMAAFVLLPLRYLFPVATKPTGLALITGASSGIGAELAYIFAKNGSDLVLVGRHLDQLEAVQSNIEKMGRKAYPIVSDLSIPGAPAKLYNDILGKGLQVDILVNNAGLGHAGDVMEHPEELSASMIGLNCTALVQLTQLFGKDMVKKKRGWILQVSSVVGWVVGPGQNLYHATKHLVRAFSEGLAIELRGSGVVQTQLMPGPVHTQFATRGHLEKTFTFSVSGAVEDPKDVARAGYEGLCAGKRGVFSSYPAAATAIMLHLMPRSLHLTLGRLMNTPTETEMDQPRKQQ